MSADGSVVIPWAGEERRFRLAIKQLRELQELINKDRGEHPIGPMTLLKRVSTYDAWHDEVREIIRLGLIGGGTRLELVPGLMKRYFDETPLMASMPIAAIILGKGLMGDKYDDTAEKKTETTAAASDLSNSASFTDQAPQSDSPLDRSTNAHSGNSRHVSTDSTGRTAAATTNPE